MPAVAHLKPSSQLVPYGAPALAALREAIQTAQGSDRLRPITVVVPSNLTGLSLRRGLARHHPLVNVRFLVLARLAELLGAPRLAQTGQIPLTRWKRYTAISSVLRRSPGSFASVSEHPSTIRALDRAFRELAPVPDSAIASFASASGAPGELARLCLLFRTETQNCYTDHELALSARAAVESGSAALADLGLVIVFLPGRLDASSRQLVHALVALGRGHVIAGLTGDPTADGPAVTVAGDLPLPFVETPSPQHIVVSADSAEEVRTVIRLAMTAATEEAIPLDRIAMLYPAREYAPLLHEQLEAAGIPHNGPPFETLAATLAGRTLLNLLNIDPRKLTRSNIFDWLASAAIHDPQTHRPVPSRRWERLATEAGVVGGIRQWRSRLAILREEFEDAAALARAQGDDDLARWRDDDVRAVDALLAFVEYLHSELENWPTEPSAALARCRELLERFLGGTHTRSQWPRAEQDAYDRVDEILHEAATGDSADAEFDLVSFRNALAWLFDQNTGRLGSFGNGVFVGPIRLAAGMQFDRVFILGMAEGLIPSLQTPDPLLPPGEREELGLLSSHDRAAEERRTYLAGLASAPHRTLLSPRADLRGGRGNHPSRWLLDAASALAGHTMASPALETLPACDWFTLLPSFSAAISSTIDAATVQEYDLRILLDGPRDALTNPLLRQPPMVGTAAGIRAWRARRFSTETRPLTEWDGNLGSIMAPSDPAAGPISASAFETMARCPFKYFLRYQLGIRDREEVADELLISPVVRGELVHRILDRFFRESHEAGLEPPPRQSWQPADYRRMAAISDAECDRDEARGITGAALPWKLERRRIRQWMTELLDADSRHREQGYSFMDAELEFGQDEPVPTLRLPDGRSIGFRGRIDRIDTGPGGAIVYDYKTGKLDPFTAIEHEDPFDRGRHLQLAIYGLAAGASARPVSAYYWFIGSQAREIGYAVSRERLQDFAGVADALDSTIGRGLFPINSGDNNENCRYCAFDAVCPPRNVRRERLLQRRDTPGLEAYAGLAGLAALNEQDEEFDDFSR